MPNPIRVVQNGEIYEITFKYDPTIVHLIKQVPGKAWNPKAKMWTIPRDRLGFLISQLKGTMYESMLQIFSDEQINVNASLPTNDEIPDIDISNVKTYVKDGGHLFKHQEDFMKYSIARQMSGNSHGFILADQPGLGKALDLDTKIYTPTGYKLMRDIQVGDKVFNEMGEPVEVLATYDHEDLEMYKVTFSDGASVICCKDHLWQFEAHQSPGIKVWTTQQIINGSTCGPKNTDWQHRVQDYAIAKCKPVHFNETPVKLDPWVVGALIGDGNFQGTPQFTNTETSMVQELQSRLPYGYELHPDSSGITYNIAKSKEYLKICKSIRCIEDNTIFDDIHSCEQYYQVGMSHVMNANKGYSYKLHKHFEWMTDVPDRNTNFLIDAFKYYGLYGCNSFSKFIPHDYLHNSIPNRILLLQGLMDTDGYADKSNHHSYSTTSRTLANQIVWLCQSLGGIAYVKNSISKLNYSDRRNYSYFEVVIKFDDPTILYLACQHKKARANVRTFKPRRTFKSIERIENRPGKCITVSGPSHLYLCEHFIVTHNTIEVMNLALYNRSFYKYKHVLIIACVNAAKYHWQEDIYTHSNHQYLPYILGTRKKKNGMLRFDTGSKEKLEDLTSTRLFSESGRGSKGLPYYCIINIEAIRTKQGRKYPIADRIIELCERGYFGMIAIDEVHKNCSPSSLQGKQLLRIKKAVKDKVMFIPMTGTPIVSRPTDAFLPLKLVDGHDFNSFYSWCQQFCVYGGFGGHEIVAYKNIDKLNDMMKYNMLRRRKQDVMDLPPKIHHTEHVENTPYQQKLYNVVAQDLITNRNIVLAHMNPLSRLLRLRQVNGAPELIDKDLVVGKDYMKYNAKISRILDLLEDIHERGEKVVIFSNWVESLRTLYRFISKKYKVCCYTGTMKEADREEHKRRFIEDPNYTIIIGTIGALGTMHNLQVATNVVFLDEPWTAADKEQAEDRCFIAGTMISTPKGFVPIEQLQTGDMVYGTDGKVHPVTDKWSHTENTELLQLDFVGCPGTITCTPDHKFLVDGKWVAAKDLNSQKDKGSTSKVDSMDYFEPDNPITQISTGFDEQRDMYFLNNFGVRQRNGRKLPIPETIMLDDDFLFLCGYYLGDGCGDEFPLKNRPGHQIQLAGNTDTKIEAIQRCKRWYEAHIPGKTYIGYEKDSKGIILYFNNSLFHDFLVDLLGPNRAKKHLPDWVDRLSTHQLLCLYDGLMASDGYDDVGGPAHYHSYITTTPALACGMWYIMQRLGYQPTIYVQTPKDEKSLPLYTVSRIVNQKQFICGRLRSRTPINRGNYTLYDITVQGCSSFFVYNVPVHNCHRSVSTEPINIYTIITKGTVDERVHNIVYTKEGVANYIVDGELDLHSHPELFDLLLADTIKNQTVSEQELLGYDEIEE